MSAMARPSRKHKKPAAAPASRLRRAAADIALVVLAVAAIGLFVAVKIVGGRGDGANAPDGKKEVSAASPSIGPDGSGLSDAFADLEAGPDEYDGDDDPLAGPAIVSDPYAARPFSPVDDARWRHRRGRRRS